MLENFWKLNGNPKGIKDKLDFISIVNAQDEIEDIIFWPDELNPPKDYPRLKIANKRFTNVSFTKTKLKDIEFTACHFEDCLFIGTTIDRCKFRECSFNNVNTDDIKIKRTYIDPKSFEKNYKQDIGKSNLAVHLFQQLLNNLRDEEQSNLSRIAEYNFRKWQGRLSQSKYKLKKPYPISCTQYLLEYTPNFLYRTTFGYGLRLRNFFYTFSIVYIFSFIINFFLWNKYKLKAKDLSIASFDPIWSGLTWSGFKANFFFTTDITTQLIDSQFQPSSDIGMLMLTIQGVLGFILFSFLITILINKFVR